MEHRPIEPGPTGEDREIYGIEPMPDEPAAAAHKAGGGQREAGEPVSASGAGAPEPAESAPTALAVPSPLPPKAVAIAAGVLALAALSIALIAHGAGVMDTILLAYRMGLHAVAGVAALALAAALLGRPVGDWADACARIVAAVALFAALSQVPLGWVMLPVLAGAVGYVLTLWSLFRFDRRTLACVAGAHAAMSMLLEIGLALSAAAARGAAQ